MTTILDVIREWRRPAVVREWKKAVLEIEQRAFSHSMRVSDNSLLDRVVDSDCYHMTLNKMLSALRGGPLGNLDARPMTENEIKETTA